MRTSGRPPELLANVCTSVAFGAGTRTESRSFQNHPQSPPRQKPARARLGSGRARTPRRSDSPEDRSASRLRLPGPRARVRPQGFPVRRREETAFLASTQKAISTPTHTQGRNQPQEGQAACTRGPEHRIYLLPLRSRSTREVATREGLDREERANLPSLSPGRPRR
jgi:hypothetical protein